MKCTYHCKGKECSYMTSIKETPVCTANTCPNYENFKTEIKLGKVTSGYAPEPRKRALRITKAINRAWKTGICGNLQIILKTYQETLQIEAYNKYILQIRRI